MVFAVLMVPLAIGMSMNPESAVQAFAYLAWAARFVAMAHTRFAVVDRGIMIGGLLPWHRIIGCVPTAYDTVRSTSTSVFKGA